VCERNLYARVTFQLRVYAAYARLPLMNSKHVAWPCHIVISIAIAFAVTTAAGYTLF